MESIQYQRIQAAVESGGLALSSSQFHHHSPDDALRSFSDQRKLTDTDPDEKFAIKSSAAKGCSFAEPIRVCSK